MSGHTTKAPPPGYFVAIGSNLSPERHVPAVIAALLDRFGRIWLSSIIRTAPFGMRSDNAFLNAVCFIPTEQASDELKRYLVRLEEMLGRDRSDPDKKLKDRAADLDILFPDSGGVLSNQTRPPEEPYIRPVYQELAAHFDLIPGPADSPEQQQTSSLELAGERLGEHPVELHIAPRGDGVRVARL
jgi:2-amino-4-hydroxy-6-hydroxymethyldihydropteridine diphosphokinase